MRSIIFLLTLSYCLSSYAQTIVGERPDILPEFLPETICDTVIVEDGIRYEGQWPDGKGILYDVNQGLVIGEFRGMKPHGQCTMYCIDGGRYQGEMKNGKEDGYGHYFSASGKIFAGKFEDNRTHGIDTLYYPDGKVFIGVVVRGRPNGYGEKYESLPEKLTDRKPVFQEHELTDYQKTWLIENHYVAPLFKGQRQSSGAFTKWVNSKIKYPKKTATNVTGGKITCEFFIDTDGSVVDVTILKSPGEAFDKELLKVLEKSPKWTPGYRGGKPTRVRYTFSVNFLRNI